MSQDPTPSFSTGRKWSISLNVLLSSLILLAAVLMVNYLAARHFARFSVSNSAQVQLAPLTVRLLGSLTNEVKVIVYFDQHEPLYASIWGLLKEYSFRNNRIKLVAVDYERNPGAADAVKAAYNLTGDKDVVIFDCNHHVKVVPQSELSDLDIQPLIAGQSREVRRTHFKGELLFTSALFNVSSPRPLRASFLYGHHEHSPEDHDSQVGYAGFAEILKQNNIEWSYLNLLGTNEIPAGNLLIAAGPTDPLTETELTKIDQFLKDGGRMLVLFNMMYNSKNTGLEKIMADWGVEASRSLVQDKPNSGTGYDIAVERFGNHPIVNPLYQGERTRLHLVAPRCIRKIRAGQGSADAPNVTELAFTGPEGTVLTDIRGTEIHPHPTTDLRTNVCLAVAVEKGKIKNVSADRGTTRMVVVGDSIFWGNQMLNSVHNREFAFLTVNWLLDQSELLAIPARPITEYRLLMTKSQLTSVTWLMLAGMPGTVLLMGLLVWVRRRK